FYPDVSPSCEPPVFCEYSSRWQVWGPPPLPFPCSNLAGIPAWNNGGTTVWTGFYGPESSIRDFNVGARVLGQQVDDRFGTAVSSDGTWLYISAPRHTATRFDVPMLPTTDRQRSGVVYQYRTDTRTSQNAPTRSQLWMEPGLTWPDVDVEGAKPLDTTMPVPHQYIIESVGSTRGNPPGAEYDFRTNGCPASYLAGFGGAQAHAAGACYQPYRVGTVGYWIDRTPQIVGPHVGSEISFVRNVGDLNDDGIDDFAVGSDKIKQDFTDPSNPTGATVGGIFIVYSRHTGFEGDYVLEDLARSTNDPRRLAGVLLLGESNERNIGRNFDGAGNFNGDTVDDMIVGSPAGADGRGEAIVIFGSRTLLSPEGGYTLDEIVDAGRAIRFIGAAEGDLAGANVAAAGDVDFDGNDDILIAAPGANPLNNPAGAPGAVYLIYGSSEYLGGQTFDLSEVGLSIPGAVFVGRNAGDQLGGGTLQITVNPDLQPTTIHSRGVAALGDLDGDGYGDFAIAAMLADPHGKTDAGEIYVLYGGCRSGECIPADTNCDASVNALDIEPFLDLLFQGADPCRVRRGEPFSTGDVNGDGSIDALDIEPFLDCLFG
ncbi:MAG: FG-GAP repeat protein, partial [Planctomycetes bacterium]|nr:FG-GAP repeat protein [Planctomycetota bacterium]